MRSGNKRRDYTLLVTLDNAKATARNNPQYHLFHRTCPHDKAFFPAPEEPSFSSFGCGSSFFTSVNERFCSADALLDEPLGVGIGGVTFVGVGGSDREPPSSFSAMFGRSFMTVSQYSGKASLNLFCCIFHACDSLAYAFLSATVVVTDPVVISSDSIKERRPVKMVATLQAGFHEPGWKSDIEKQIFLSGWKRPEGVTILMPGGLKGYSEGNIMTP